MSVVTFLIASALGAVVRFWLERNSVHHFGEAKPWGTFAANLLGSFLLGWSVSHFADSQVQPMIAAFCGSFTTFGGFVGQGFQRMRHRSSRTFALLYIGATVAGSVGLAFVGLLIG